MYFSLPSIVAAATASVPHTGPIPAFSAIAAQSWYNLGPFGVALFFLISGFVIPISLEKLDPRAFLVARVFRIFPTYMCGLMLGLGAVALGAAYWHQPLPFTRGTLLANLFLVTDITGAPSIDLVNWTLIVELKFYLLIALLAVPLRRASVATLFGVALAILALSALAPAAGALHSHAVNVLVALFSSSALYVLYMSIGIVFYQHVRGRIGTVTAALSGGGLFAAFVACWPLTMFRDQFPVVTINYGWALIVFTLLYAGRAHVPSLRVVAFFADISYPLYIIHPLVGWTIMGILIVSLHVDPAAAAVIAFAIVATLAYLLHVTVEMHSQSIGRSLAESLAERDAKTLPSS